jgi:hypothetical protein
MASVGKMVVVEVEGGRPWCEWHGQWWVMDKRGYWWAYGLMLRIVLCCYVALTFAVIKTKSLIL